MLDKLPGHPVVKLEYRVQPGDEGHGGQIRRYLADFARCIRGEGQTSSPALDGAKTVAVGEAIKESVRTNRPVAPRTAF